MHFTSNSLLRLFPWQWIIFTLSSVQLLKCIKGKVLSLHKGVNSFCCSPLRLIQISGKLNFFQLSDVTIYNCFTRPAVWVWGSSCICLNTDMFELKTGSAHSSQQAAQWQVWSRWQAHFLSDLLLSSVSGLWIISVHDIFVFWIFIIKRNIYQRNWSTSTQFISIFVCVLCQGSFTIPKMKTLWQSTKYFVSVPSVRHGCNTHIKPRGLTAMSGTLHPQYQVINEKNKAKMSCICERLVFLDYYDVIDYIEKCDGQNHSLTQWL